MIKRILRFLKFHESKLPLGIEALFPAIMALALFAAITNILYSGGRRENLAAVGEKHLIERSLKADLKPASHAGRVVTISLTDDDLAHYVSAPSHLVKDASLEVYADLLKVVAAENPKMVVVSWLTSAHPTSTGYWEPMRAALTAVGRPDDIMIAYPIAEVGSIPKDIRESFNVKEGEDCIYEVNSFCTYNPAWKNWLLQTLAERLWQKPSKYHISNNLPHVLPNYLLNLPLKASIPNFSFRDILEHKRNASKLKDSIVFIGNSTTQSIPFQNNKSVLRRTFTVENAQGKNLLEDGTPLHIFWAQVAQMFIDGRTVAVTPVAVNIIILAFLGCAILLVLIKLGSAAGLAFFMMYAVLFPLVNDYGVSKFKVYVPMFDVTYGGFLVFLFSTFGLLSYNNFRTWQLQAKRRMFESTADLKSNFISLISHNLNTPIAKLQGLIDIMITSNQFASEKGALQTCRNLVARLLLCVRTVLLTSSVEQHALNNAGIKLGALIKEFEESFGSTLSRLGIRTEIEVENEENSFATVYVDLKIFSHLIGIMAATVCELQPGHAQIKINLEESFSFNQEGLSLQARCLSPAVSGKIRTLLVQFKNYPGKVAVVGQDFLLQAAVRFILVTAKAYGAEVEMNGSGSGEVLVFALKSKSSGALEDSFSL